MKPSPMEPLTNKPTDQELIEKSESYLQGLKIEYPTKHYSIESFDELLTRFKSLTENRHESAKCDSDHLSIDELLSEFKRQGFNTENWDGEEGAEKAIVDGVVNAMNTVVNDLTTLASESTKTGVEEIVKTVMVALETANMDTYINSTPRDRIYTALTKLLEK